MSTEKKTHRSQVPDFDPQYQEIRRERLADAKDEIWASGAVHLYEASLQTVKRVTWNIRQLEEEAVKIKALLDVSGNTEGRGKLNDKLSELEKVIAYQNVFLTRSSEEDEGRIYESFEEMLQEIWRLERLAPKGDLTVFLRNRLEEMLSDPQLVDELRSYFGDGLEDLTAPALCMKVLKREIPVDFLYKVARRHVEITREISRRAEEIIDGYKKEFLEAIHRGVAEGWLPVDLKKIEPRLDLVKYRLMDKLAHIRSNTVGNHAADGVIGFSTEQLVESKLPRLRKTIFHELLHEVAGKLIQMTVTEDVLFDGRKDVYGRVHDRKTGVSITGKDGYSSPRFTWLNEAITEWLAIRLSGYESDADGYKGSFSYMEERRELDRLFAAGLSEGVVLEAYFENMDSAQPSEGKGRHFAALIKAVNRLEGDTVAFHRLENRFLLEETASYLRSAGVWKENALTSVSDFPPGTKIYEIFISVGLKPKSGSKRPDSSVDEKFVYVLFPLDKELDITEEEEYQKMEQSVKNQIYRIGKRKFRYTIVEKK